jgi:hypothetical protein
VADEIELLRRFIDEIPGPSTDAWARARAAIATVRAEEEPAEYRHNRRPGRRRRRQRVRRWLVPAAAGAGVAAAVGGLLAALLPASPAAMAPGARQVAEAAYVVSRVRQAVSSPGQDMAGYARTVLPPGSTWMPGAGRIGSGSASGARSPGVIGSAVTWWYGSAEETTGFSPAGQPVLAARTTITAGGRVTTVVVNYRDRTWWRESSTVPAGQLPSGCSAETAVRSWDWPDFIRGELRCGQFRLAGRQRVDGITAIEVIQRQGRVRLWVNPATYLPVRLVVGGPQPIQAEFRWLRVAQAPPGGLGMPVPAGFREVPPQA